MISCFRPARRSAPALWPPHLGPVSDLELWLSRDVSSISRSRFDSRIPRLSLSASFAALRNSAASSSFAFFRRTRSSINPLIVFLQPLWPWLAVRPAAAFFSLAVSRASRFSSAARSLANSFSLSTSSLTFSTRAS